MKDSLSGIIGIIECDEHVLLRPQPSAASTQATHPDTRCFLKLFSPPVDADASADDPLDSAADQVDRDEAAKLRIDAGDDYSGFELSRVVIADLSQLRVDLLRELEIIQQRLARMLNETV